jgi:AraC-like DNA-binding protein
LFEGIVPAGTLRVVGHSRPATIECRVAGDLMNFHVRNDYLRERQCAAHPDAFEQAPDLDGLVIRDRLVHLLSQALRSNNTHEALYVKTLGTTLVMHIAGARLPKQTASALPKWRLKRVSEYIDRHLNQEIGLADLASVAGLSRMHFAAQFKVATGCSPHDYLLHRRIESAKSAMICTDRSVAAVALDAGFQAQSHFTTVFKRLTGLTPARWRRVAVNAQRLGRPERDR